MALIRVAIGGSVRDQISQEALGELVGWDKYKVSRLERGAQSLSRDDAIALAKIDPLRRGPAWVMFGDEDEGGGAVPTETGPGTPPTETRATRQVDARTLKRSKRPDESDEETEGKRRPGSRAG